MTDQQQAPTQEQLNEINKLRSIPVIGKMIPESIDFTACCGASRKVKTPRNIFVLPQPSQRATNCLEHMPAEQLKNLEGIFATTPTPQTIYGDTLAQITAMPIALANVFVSAFAGYGANTKLTTQRGLHIHDLALAVADFCSPDDRHKAAALFRLCVANNVENKITEAKFRMILPLLLSSAVFFDHIYSADKQKSKENFEQTRIKADALEAVHRSLFQNQLDSNTPSSRIPQPLLLEENSVDLARFEIWCWTCGRSLLQMLQAPLQTLLNFNFENETPPSMPVVTCPFPKISPASFSSFSTASSTVMSGAVASSSSASAPFLISPEQMWILSGHMPETINRHWERVFVSTGSLSLNDLDQHLWGTAGILVIIKDDAGATFGAFFRQIPKINQTSSRNRFATTQHQGSFLFALYPTTLVFTWKGTHKNCLYIGDDGFGSGGELGKMGLFVEANLASGHSFETETFGNTSLSSFEDFDIVQIEAWLCKNLDL